MTGRIRNAWWIVPIVVGGLFIIHTRTTLLLDGVLAVVVGLVVTLDIGGAADTVPVPMRWSRINFNTSRAGTRKTYRYVVLWGVIMIVATLARPDVLHVR